MSINSALAAGASGLLANSFALAAISDNIANVNTVGYKRVATTFSANYETTKGAGDARQRMAACGVENNPPERYDEHIAGVGRRVTDNCYQQQHRCQ